LVAAKLGALLKHVTPHLAAVSFTRVDWDGGKAWHKVAWQLISPDLALKTPHISAPRQNFKMS